jgi:signal transduction histidine kinase
VPKPDDRADVGESRLQIWMGLLLIGLTAFTAVAFLTPVISVALINERLDLIINTGASIGALAIAGLAWARYRVTAEAAAFAQAAAFLALGTVNAAALLVLAANRGAELGFSLDDPGPLPVLSFMLARFVAAALLLVGGVWAIRRTTLRPHWAGVMVAVPTVFTLALLSVLSRTDPESLLSQAAYDHLRRLPGDPLEPSLLSAGLLGVQLGIGAMFLAGAGFAYRTVIRDHRPADAYLAIGLVLAAFSQVHAAVNPGSYAALVTTGDFLRVGFYAVLLAGVFVQSRSDVRTIQEANAELRLLRDAEVNRALLEERGRVAREMHDGLAQDLWTARLKQGRLASMVDGEGQRALAQEVIDAIDTGIADARQAVMAMRAGSTDAPLLDVVERYVEDFGDRFALDARFEATGSAPVLPARSEAEVLRIVQEALNNVRKHADATVVRVSASATDEGLEIMVMDNGRGFDDDRPTSGFGLVGMRERAALIGARFAVQSAPSDGTRVVIAIPTGAVR